MKKFIIAMLAMFVFAGTVFAGPNDLSMVVVGQKEPVLSVIRKALDADIPNGARTDWSGRVGYWTQFRGFFTGQTGLGVEIHPMTTGDAMVPTAYKLMFAYKTQRGDGLQHIRSLIDQVAKQASTQGDVAVATNPEAYKTLMARAGECFKALETDPELAPIASKLSLNRGDVATLAQMADETKPTGAEKAVIPVWAGKRDACNALQKLEASFIPGDIRIPVHLAAIDAMNLLILNLYKGQLTYGDFALQRKAAYATYGKQLAEISAGISKDQANAADTERQRQIEQAQLMIEQQKANALQTQANKPAPVPIQPSINCTSSAMGGVVHTNCN